MFVNMDTAGQKMVNSCCEELGMLVWLCIGRARASTG
jgi:hypothetical protein